MLVHKGSAEIRTPRLLLRPFRIGDEKCMFKNWASDPEVCKFLSWPPHPSEDATAKVIAYWVGKAAEANFYCWAMEYEGEPIGSISVINIEEAAMGCEIGYCMGRAWWNIGLMTEAARAVTDFLIKEAKFHRVMAKHDTQNPGSGRVMQKIGMKYEGTLRHCGVRRDGTFYDKAYYAVLSDEWE